MPDEPSWLPPRPPGEDRPGRLWAGPPDRDGWLPPAPPVEPVPRDGQRRRPPEFVHADGRPKNGAAVAGVAMGIGGLALLILSLGLLFPVSIPCSTGAWAFAIVARRRLHGDVVSRAARQARLALALGIGGVVLGFVAGIVWIALLATGADLPGNENLPPPDPGRPA
jgi:hypothetical protein